MIHCPNRTGVNTGIVVANHDPGADQQLATGDAVNLAARLEQAAPENAIYARRGHLSAGSPGRAGAGGCAPGCEGQGPPRAGHASCRCTRDGWQCAAPGHTGRRARPDREDDSYHVTMLF